MGFSVAIDGPAGAGKSTLARKIAESRGFIYIDTGAMYRAMALCLIREGIDPADTAALETGCRRADISIAYDQEGQQIVLLNGENVNALIRTREVGNMASVSSANGEVRRRLVALQQKLAKSRDVIMDGRDIGTCVLPEADVKIFLTADSRVRALRRFDELAAKGEPCDLDAIEAEIIERDKRDMEREISPLRQAEDAILVDTSHLGIEEAAEEISRIIAERRR